MADTVQDAIDHGDIIRVHCASEGCGHNAELSLSDLGERLGFDHGVMHDDLKRKFRCSECGGRQVTFICSNKASRQISSAYAKSRGV